MSMHNLVVVKAYTYLYKCGTKKKGNIKKFRLCLIFKLFTMFSFTNSNPTKAASSFLFFEVQMSKTKWRSVWKNSPTWTSITATASLHSFSATHISVDVTPLGQPDMTAAPAKKNPTDPSPGTQTGARQSAWRALALHFRVRARSERQPAGRFLPLLDSVSDGPVLQLLASSE